MAEDTVRQECDERTGEYRENEAAKDRDPLHDVFRDYLRLYEGRTWYQRLEEHMDKRMKELETSQIE
jgi:hypothetical protein